MVPGCAIVRATSPCFGVTMPTGRGPAGPFAAEAAVSGRWQPAHSTAASAASPAPHTAAGSGERTEPRNGMEILRPRGRLLRTLTRQAGERTTSVAERD